MTAAHRPELAEGSVTLRPGREGDLSFAVEVAEKAAGELVVHRLPGRDATGLLSWSLEGISDGDRATAVRLLVDHALGDGGLTRVEAYVEEHDRSAYRAASLAGLRKEGLVRGYADGRDHWLLGRVAGDPDAFSREGFIAALNAGLPRKRAIAQGLIRNARGEVLLCELVYKRFWDLPGGVVDPHESPADAVVREISEELGVQARIRSLAVVSWLPPWRGWDDATLFLFDVRVSEADVAGAVLEPREIRALHWADEVTVKERTADYTARLIDRATRLIDDGAGTAYLEDGVDPRW